MKTSFSKTTLVIMALCLFINSSHSSTNHSSFPHQIAYVSATPYDIWVKGSGFADSSIIVFQVLNSLGNPISSGSAVNFSVITSLTNEPYITPTFAITDDNGRVSTVLHAGFSPDVSQIQASIDTNSISIKSQPVRITIHSQRPTQVHWDKDQTVKNFDLFQNYPNPFNPSTSISYTLPLKSHIELEILNILGERIALIDEGERDAGVTTVHWTANLSSGIYFCRLNSSQGTFIRKMFLLK